MSNIDLDEELAIQESHWQGRLITIGVLLVIGVAIGVSAYAFFFRGSTQDARPTEDITVGRATINANLIISGTAGAQLISDMTFRSAGRIGSVNVQVGDSVRRGDVLASLEADDLANNVTTAEANVASAQLRLTLLLEGATDAELSAAEQSAVAAEATLNQAIRDAEDLLDGPKDAALAAEEQAVLSAQIGLLQALRDRETLMDGPTEVQVAAAEQAVVSAQVAVNRAQRGLDDLDDELLNGPGAAELAVAEQAVAAAEAALASADASHDRLLEGASSAELAAAESAVSSAEQAVTSAENALSNAQSNLDAADAAFRSARLVFCDEFLADPICSSFVVPLNTTTVDGLLGLLGGTPTSTPEPTPTGTPPPAPTATPIPVVSTSTSVTALISANAAYIAAANALETTDDSEEAAEAALDAAEAALDDLRDGADDVDIEVSQAAVLSAEASLQAAQLALDDVVAGPDQDEIDEAEDDVLSAQAALATALVDREDLLAGPDTFEAAGADDAVRSARATLATAVARQDDLMEGPTDREFAAAEDIGRAAQASLDAAIARLDETIQGPRATAIALERQAVRTAQLAVSAARIQLRNAQIIAPFDGTVAAVNASPGEFVTSATTPPPIVLLTPDAIILEINIGETDYPSIQLDQGGVVVFDAMPGAPFPFTVTKIGLSPTVTQGVVTYAVTGALTILPGRPRPAPGMNARGQIITDARTDILVIPPRAIRRRGAEQVVDVRRGEAIEEQVITTGLTDTANVEVLTGLEEGDVIVVPILVTGAAAGNQAAPTLPAGIR